MELGSVIAASVTAFTHSHAAAAIPEVCSQQAIHVVVRSCSKAYSFFPWCVLAVIILGCYRVPEIIF